MAPFLLPSKSHKTLPIARSCGGRGALLLNPRLPSTSSPSLFLGLIIEIRGLGGKLISSISGWHYLASAICASFKSGSSGRSQKPGQLLLGRAQQLRVGWPLAIAGWAGRQVYVRESEVPHKIELPVGIFQ